MKNKLQIKFLIWFFFFSLLPLFIISISNYTILKKVIGTTSLEKLTFAANFLKDECDDYYETLRQNASKFRNNSFFPIFSAFLNHKIPAENIVKILNKELEKEDINFSVMTLDIFSRKVNFVYNPISDASFLRYIQKFKEEHITLTPVFTSQPLSQYLIAPLYSERGQILILIVHVNLDYVKSVLTSIAGYDPKLDYIVLSSSHFVFSSLPVLNEKNYSRIQFEGERLILNGKEYIFHNVILQEDKLFINLLMDESLNASFLNVVKTRYILALLIFIMLLALLGYFVSRRVTHSMNRLIQITQEIGKGNLDTKIDIKTGDEFEDLANNIVDMKERLRHYNNLLEHEVVLRTEELQSARRQIQHQEKMINLGMLAAGVAHEIGNPLTSISNLTQLLLKRTSDEKERTYLELMKKNIERISEIVEDLVNFSRPSQDRFEVVSINQVVEQAVKIVKFDKKGKRIKYITLLDERNPRAEVIEGQLLQVLVNLLFNAMDAVEIEKGLITVSTAQQGNFVSIKVIDNGEGIPKHLHEKIFEPFFTTKEVGKGTGLGLSVSYTIIKNFNGNIILRSEPGEGTEFEIILPVKQKEKEIHESQITHS